MPGGGVRAGEGGGHVPRETNASMNPKPQLGRFEKYLFKTLRERSAQQSSWIGCARGNGNGAPNGQACSGVAVVWAALRRPALGKPLVCRACATALSPFCGA